MCMPWSKSVVTKKRDYSGAWPTNRQVVSISNWSVLNSSPVRCQNLGNSFSSFSIPQFRTFSRFVFTIYDLSQVLFEFFRRNCQLMCWCLPSPVTGVRCWAAWSGRVPPKAVDSSCSPPESVTMTLACDVKQRKSLYPNGSRQWMFGARRPLLVQTKFFQPLSGPRVNRKRQRKLTRNLHQHLNETVEDLGDHRHWRDDEA